MRGVERDGRIRLVFDEMNRLKRCFAIGPDGEEVHLPILNASERYEPHRPAVTTLELHRFRVIHEQEGQ